MELYLLMTICGLLILAIILIIFLRNKSGNELPQLQSKMLELQSSLAKIESNLKEDFRISRQENTTIAQENRRELNDSLKDIKTDLSETLKTITDQSRMSLNEINKTLVDKTELLNTKLENNNKVNRDDQAKNIRDFTFEQRTKFDELKLEQKELTNKTEELLDKIITKVEVKLNA